MYLNVLNVSKCVVFSLLFQKKQNAELSRIMGELKVDSESQNDDDLLDLMDSAQWDQIQPK